MSKILMTLVLITGFLNPCVANDTLVIWHALDGELGKVFNDLLCDFEKQEPTIKIQAIYKGNYDKTLETFLDNSQEPDIVQVFEMGTAVMQAKKKFTPIAKVFSWIKKPVPRFTPASTSFYAGHAKTLQCLPFSCSTVVLFYNKTLFESIGARPPETFEDFQEMAIKFRNEGTLLTLAAGWLSGHHMDQIGAIHNIPIATNGNGVDASNAKLVDNPFFNTHWMFLQAWYKAGLFSIKAGPEAEKAFADGEVALISQGANRQEILQKAVDGRFKIGVAHFPYWKSIGKPGKTIAGGSAFWVSKKKYSSATKIALAK